MSWPTTWSILTLATLSVAALPANPSSPAKAKQLSSDEIRKALGGKSVYYTFINEAYLEDGSWRGFYHGSASVAFSGRWTIDKDQLCVVADPDTIVRSWHPEQFCRRVWEDPGTAQLRMVSLLDHPSSSYKMGLQAVYDVAIVK